MPTNNKPAIANRELFVAELSPTEQYAGVDRMVNALLRDANKAQQRIAQHCVAASLNGITAGKCIAGIRNYLPPGYVRSTIINYFCEPNGLSYRTAQRYMLLAENADKLLAGLRQQQPELSNKTDDEILSSLSINKAISLIRQLFKLDLLEALPVGVTPPKPDPNGWHTPDFIVQCILELFTTIDIDPCAIPSYDPFAAKTTISSPKDGLANDVIWSGRVFLNPGIKGVKHSDWAARLLHEFNEGNVEEGVILVPACTNSCYSKLLRTYPRAFANSAIETSGPNLARSRIKQPLMLVYVGHEKRFRDFASAFNHSPFDVFLSAN